MRIADSLKSDPYGTVYFNGLLLGAGALNDPTTKRQGEAYFAIATACAADHPQGIHHIDKG